MKSANIMDALVPDEKWFLFLYIGNDKTRKLILKARADQQDRRLVWGVLGMVVLILKSTVKRTLPFFGSTRN